MERLLEMIGILAALYVAYALSMGKWTYESTSTKREQRDEELKRAGLSSQFYFMNACTLVLLSLASAGTFTFYWLYKQWQRIHNGFKRDGKQLHGSAFWRAVAGIWSFFALGNLINRTCEYMHRETSWPACLWGILWLSGLVILLSPVEYGWKIAGYVIFCTVPAIFQRRINTLTHGYLPLFPRAIELAATLTGAICVAAFVMIWKLLSQS